MHTAHAVIMAFLLREGVSFVPKIFFSVYIVLTMLTVLFLIAIYQRQSSTLAVMRQYNYLAPELHRVSNCATEPRQMSTVP